MTAISLNVNGATCSLQVDARDSLADVLREKLTLTATHLGCEHGACGACTVDLDGVSVRACLTLGVMCDGRNVTTLEGMGDDPIIAVLRRQFHESHALQCGFCTPGMLMMARDLLSRSQDLDEDKVRKGLSGHICRCTGYAGIVQAVLKAAEELKKE